VIYRFTVGRMRCAVISDGQMSPPWEPPLAAFFTPAAGVPEGELHAALAAEGRPKATVSCGYNCVLAETGDGYAVIDTGLGPRFLGYGPPIEPLVGRLGDGLASAGAPAAELAAVVFTHLHQDHCRGATWSGALAFPRATGFAHAAEVAFWSGAQVPCDVAGEHLGSAREAIRLFGSRLRQFEHDTEILPGVRTVDAAGHTPGHSAVLLDSGGERLLCTGDLFYDQLQLSHPGWCTPWDHDRVRAVRARRRLLDRAADERLLVHAYHMPFPGLGTIARRGSAYKWQPLQNAGSPGTLGRQLHRARDPLRATGPAEATCSLQQLLSQQRRGDILPGVISSEATRLGEEAACRLARSGQYEIAPGLTDAEFTRVERDFGFEFADDHRAFLAAGLPLNRPPEEGQTWCKPWPDWRDGDPGYLRDQLGWPVEGALFDVETNALWRPSWGRRPAGMSQALSMAQRHLAQVPTMVPVYAHRYLPAGRGTYGHPVLSIYQTDIIIYGTDLAEYIRHEFTDPDRSISTDWSPPPMVPFWSEFL
jgi:glyoxylase-like metal-dependent hydrolase (beta-lactamase superfamily II)